MAFRDSFSRFDNAPEARVLSTMEMVIVVGGNRVGRCQGLRRSMQAQPRPVNEMGSDRAVEFVPGIKRFQGTLQSITVKYGDLVKRLASMSGGTFDSDSKAATMTNFPEFEIQCFERGTPQYNTPQLYAAPAGSQDLAGNGKLVVACIGCIIESAEQSFNVNESLIMESVSFSYVDEVSDADKKVNKTVLSDSSFTNP